MKVEDRRKMKMVSKEVKEIYKRIKKRNKKTKLTLVDILNLKKEFPDVDIEAYIDSSMDYYENKERIEGMKHESVGYG